MEMFNQLREFVTKNKFPILIFFGLSVLISIIFPTGFSIRYSYQLDDIAREPIIAPFDFGILKTEQKLNSDLSEAKKSVSYSFTRNQDVVDNQLVALDTFFIYINDVRNSYYQYISSQDSLYKYRYEPEFESFQNNFIADSTTYNALYNEFLNRYSYQVDKNEWEKLIGITEDTIGNPTDLDQLKTNIKQICLNRWAEGILDIPLLDIISEEISIIQGGGLIISAVSNYNDVEGAWRKNKEEINSFYNDETGIETILGYELVNEFIKPNIIFDKELTEKNQKEQLDRVSRFQGTVLGNELIVDANNRVTESVLLKLKSLQFEYERRLGYEKATDKLREYLGAYLIVSILLFLLFSFIHIYRRNYFKDYKMLFLISIVVYGLMLIAWMIMNYQVSAYFIPIAIASMLFTVLLDASVSMLISIVLILLTSLLIGNNLDFAIMQFFVVFVSIYSVRRLRKRRQIITTMFALLFSAVFVFFSIMLFKGIDFLDYNYSEIGFFALTSFLSPILSFGLVPLFESSFGITTDYSLIELLDYDQPLQKRLIEEAPGTHTHSIKVGTLAESSANAVGARALLCRVGAYYHDIGKLEKPEYYAENQQGENKHDSITPNMSAKILKQHVADGLALADEYGLPSIVKDFIATHHGTKRMEYFYQKALNESPNQSDIDESRFRYNGPKPTTKETAIVMIAEAIEAQANSFKNPSVEKFDAMIEKSIKDLLQDGQLDECPLTLDDLRKIKGSVDGKDGLIPVLSGLYHSRPEYPSKKNDD